LGKHTKRAQLVHPGIVPPFLWVVSATGGQVDLKVRCRMRCQPPSLAHIAPRNLPLHQNRHPTCRRNVEAYARFGGCKSLSATTVFSLGFNRSIAHAGRGAGVQQVLVNVSSIEGKSATFSH
jgi:hypothetical protein